MGGLLLPAATIAITVTPDAFVATTVALLLKIIGAHLAKRVPQSRVRESREDSETGHTESIRIQLYKIPVARKLGGGFSCAGVLQANR
jgi:hypothetical protein